MQHDTPDRALHPHGELDQSLAQRGDLGVGAGGAAGAASEVLEEDVRRQREQDARVLVKRLDRYVRGWGEYFKRAEVAGLFDRPGSITYVGTSSVNSRPGVLPATVL